MELSLQSNFREWYDLAFKPSGLPDTQVLRRLTSGGMSRPKMMQYLDTIGYRPPRYGSVNALYAEFMRTHEGWKPRGLPRGQSRMSIFIWIENNRYGFSIMRQGRVIYTCQPRSSAERRPRSGRGPAWRNCHENRDRRRADRCG